MRGNLHCCLLLTLMAAAPAIAVTPAIAAAPATWHVAPAGNDTSDGSPASPLRTLAAALDRAAARPDGPATIHLAAGDYRVTKPIAIDSRHASTKRGPLTITGSLGTVLTGFLPVPPDAWRAPDAASRALLLAATRDKAVLLDLSFLPATETGHLGRRGFNLPELDQTAPVLLFLGENRMTLSRWPDGPAAKPGAILDPGPTRDGNDRADFHKRGGTFRFDPAKLAQWSAEPDLWLDGILSQDWVWSFNKVQSIDPTAGTLTLRFGEVNGLMHEEWLHPGFHATNAISEITVPGEYHIDSTRRRILFLPPEPGDSWKITARLLHAPGPLLDIKDASGLTISNLALEGSRGPLVHATGIDNLTLSRLDFRHAAGLGIAVAGTKATITDCTFIGLGAGGIHLIGGDEATLKPSGHRVTRCTFRDTSWWLSVFRPAIMPEGVGHEIHACLFEDLPHMAIEAKGNNFLIHENVFRRTCLAFRDMGAIYFNLGENPLRRGSIIRDNIFSDIGRGGVTGPPGKRCAVYLDNATNGVAVTGNLFRDIGSAPDDWTVMNHGGDHNTVTGNLFTGCPLPYHMACLFATWGKDLLPGFRKQWHDTLTAPAAAPRLAAYPELATFLTDNRVHPAHNSFSGNTIVPHAPGSPVFTVNGGPDTLPAVHNNTIVPSLPDTPPVRRLREIERAAGAR